MTHKPHSVPDGYASFLMSQARYRDLSERHLADVIAEGLHMSSFDFEESRAMKLAAQLTLTALTSGGIELMFDERDVFKGVVT